MDVLAELDGILRRSLKSFYQDLCGMESCGREREAVSHYAFANLVKCCKDLVIWRDPNTILLKADLPYFEPLAVMEWKMIHVYDRPRDRKRKLSEYESDIRWLQHKARAVGKGFVGYAVFVDSTCDPKRLTCARVAVNETDRHWAEYPVTPPLST
jgi:hypothetical protein